MSSLSPHEDAKRIATLNDSFRTTFVGGSVFVSAGIQALGPEFVADALAAVRTFDDFTGGNDPYKEHDFGSAMVQGQKLFWKIDYYDPSMMYGSEDPGDPKATRRVLTVMLAEEY
jgi:hypothetical protein